MGWEPLKPSPSPRELADLITTELGRCRELLLRDAGGRRQRLFGHLVGAGRAVLETTAAHGEPVTLTAAWLVVHAVVTHNSGRADLAAPLGRRLRELVPLPDELADYHRDEVTRTFAACQLGRVAMILPSPLACADGTWLKLLADRLNSALCDLPPELWRDLALSALRPPRPHGGLLIVIPSAGGEPWDLMAATPPGAGVIDARAERLTEAELLAEVHRSAPEQVAIDLRGGGDGLADAIAALVPSARLIALGRETVAAPFAAALAGPPFGALAGLAERSGAVPPLPYPALGDLRAWPLACYDGEVIVPVRRRGGAQLACDLQAAHAAAPPARLRLAGGVSDEQLAELAAAMPLPTPVQWSTVEPLSGDLSALRRAGWSA